MGCSPADAPDISGSAAYIIFVNSNILAAAGMDKNAVFIATCIAAAAGTVIMGIYANYPIAMGPGMGLNAFFAFAAGKGMGVSWQIALSAVFCSGILFLILSVLPVRAWIINSIPRSQKLAIAAGFRLFLGFIGLKSGGIVADHPVTFVTAGKLTSPPVLLAFLGLIIMIALDHRNITGSIIIGILLVAITGFLLGVSPAPSGIISAPPSIAPTFLALDISGLLQLGATTPS